MLDFYVDIDFKRRHLRQCPVGEYLDGSPEWLHAAGAQRFIEQMQRRITYALTQRRESKSLALQHHPSYERGSFGLPTS